jgi:hypothetical protein
VVDSNGGDSSDHSKKLSGLSDLHLARHRIGLQSGKYAGTPVCMVHPRSKVCENKNNNHRRRRSRRRRRRRRYIHGDLGGSGGRGGGGGDGGALTYSAACSAAVLNVWSRPLLCLAQFNVYWDYALALLCLYVAVAVPFRVGFQVELCPTHFQWWWDIGVDCVFITDIVLNFRTGEWV